MHHTNSNRSSSISSYSPMIYVESDFIMAPSLDEKKGKLQRNKRPSRVSENIYMATIITLSSTVILLRVLHLQYLLEGVHPKYFYTHKNEEQHQMHSNESIYRRSNITNMLISIVLSIV